VDWSGRKQTSVCKPNCKPTVQHSMIRDITNRDHRIINPKSEHTLNLRSAPLLERGPGSFQIRGEA
jgi:hypothetical protein